MKFKESGHMRQKKPKTTNNVLEVRESFNSVAKTFE